MSRFAETLRDLHGRLDVPHPARSRIVLEVAADLEELYALHREKGYSEEEALAEARRRCALDADALASLVAVHTSASRRFLDRLGERARTRGERIVLGALLLFVALFVGPHALSAPLFVTAGPFAWIVGALLLAAGGLLASKLYAIFLLRDHDLSRLRAGTPGLLALAGACAFVGAVGHGSELWLATRRMAADPDRFLEHLVAGARGGAALLIVSLLAAVVIAVGWSWVAGRIARIEAAELSCLLLTESDSPGCHPRPSTSPISSAPRQTR